MPILISFQTYWFFYDHIYRFNILKGIKSCGELLEKNGGNPRFLLIPLIPFHGLGKRIKGYPHFDPVDALDPVRSERCPRTIWSQAWKP